VDAHVPKYVKRADHRHLLEEADIIIGFERVQLKTIPKNVRNKTLLLTQFVTGEAQDIPDPYFEASIEVLSKTLQKFAPCSTRSLPRSGMLKFPELPLDVFDSFLCGDQEGRPAIFFEPPVEALVHSDILRAIDQFIR